MRDPQRIDKISIELAEIWHKVPDMRLGQLINNFQIYKGNDCFYIEDSQFIDELRTFVDGMTNKH